VRSSTICAEASNRPPTDPAGARAGVPAQLFLGATIRDPWPRRLPPFTVSSSVWGSVFSLAATVATRAPAARVCTKLFDFPA
jgi:hypothetical protein